MSRKKHRAKYNLLAKKKQGPIRFKRWSNWKKKWSILERLSGEQNHQCAYCFKPTWSEVFGEAGPPNSMATIEHFIPLSLGGSNHYDNLVMACSRCNQNRGTKPALLFYYDLRGKIEGGWMRLERAKDRLTYNPGILHVGNTDIEITYAELERLHECDKLTPPVGQAKWNHGRPIWWNKDLRFIQHPPNYRKPWYVPWNRYRANRRRKHKYAA